MSASPAGVAAAAVAALALLAGCGGEDRPTFDDLPWLTAPPTESPSADPSATGSPDPSAVPSIGPTATLGPTETAAPTGDATSTPVATAPLADGRHPARIGGVDVATGTVTVDVVQFFTGTAATQAATEDRAQQIPPPDGVWVRNRESLLHTLAVAPAATITVNTLAAEETGDPRRDLAIDLRRLAGYPSLEGRVFWVTVTGGTVVLLAEQYLP